MTLSRMCSWQRPEVEEAGLVKPHCFPFSFGLVIQQVFDTGCIYSHTGLDITEQILHSLPGGHSRVASVCRLAAQSLPQNHNGYKWVPALPTRRTPSHLLKRFRSQWLLPPLPFLLLLLPKSRKHRRIRQGCGFSLFPKEANSVSFL